jgi:hypothetical protein
VALRQPIWDIGIRARALNEAHHARTAFSIGRCVAVAMRTTPFVFPGDDRDERVADARLETPHSLSRIASMNSLRGFLFAVGFFAHGSATPSRAGGQDAVVDRARSIAIETKPFWTALGYGTLRAQYTIGWAAAPVAGYTLLGAPALTLLAVTSGAAAPGVKVSVDALLKLAELAIGSPSEAARRIAASQRDESLRLTAIAFPIGKRLVSGETVTRAEAEMFLDARWGLARLNAAGVLYSATIGTKTATERVASTETRALVGRLIDTYQLRALGLSDKLPIARAAFFIKDLSAILRASGEGLAAYAPFQSYEAALDAIDSRRAAERRELGLLMPTQSQETPPAVPATAPPAAKPTVTIGTWQPRWDYDIYRGAVRELAPGRYGFHYVKYYRGEVPWFDVEIRNDYDVMTYEDFVVDCVADALSQIYPSNPRTQYVNAGRAIRVKNASPGNTLARPTLQAVSRLQGGADDARLIDAVCAAVKSRRLHLVNELPPLDITQLWGRGKR